MPWCRAPWNREENLGTDPNSRICKLDNGSCSGSGSCSFHRWLWRCKQKFYFLLRIWLIIFFLYVIQHFFICRTSNSTVSEDATIEPRPVATTALIVRLSYHSAIDVIHILLFVSIFWSMCQQSLKSELIMSFVTHNFFFNPIKKWRNNQFPISQLWSDNKYKYFEVGGGEGGRVEKLPKIAPHDKFSEILHKRTVWRPLYVLVLVWHTVGTLWSEIKHFSLNYMFGVWKNYKLGCG
jgi:hypothetical protein